MADSFNQTLADQVVRPLWLANAKEDERDRLHLAALATLISIAPKDEVEGMLAAQMVAAHNATMECYRRAMIGSQSHEGWQSNLTHAGKLSRTYVQLLEALNRRRGKTGSQKVTVEHVHVHAGAQAIVGTVEAPLGRGGVKNQNQGQPHAKSLSHASSAAAVERGRGAGALAADRRCRTGAVECMGAVSLVRRRAGRTACSDIGAAPPRPLPNGAC